MARVTLGKTAMSALKALDDNGPLQLSHGYRYASISLDGIYLMSSTNHLLRTENLVEWAGGNYDRHHVRITDYGRDCLARGSHVPGSQNKGLPPFTRFHASYGPAALSQQASDE